MRTRSVDCLKLLTRRHQIETDEVLRSTDQESAVLLEINGFTIRKSGSSFTMLAKSTVYMYMYSQLTAHGSRRFGRS